MKRVVRKLIFPRGTLPFGYALVAFVCVSQVFALSVFGKINSALAGSSRSIGRPDTSNLEALFLLVAPISIWAVAKNHLGKGNGWANFLRHLPVSERFIYRSKIKADLAVTVVPTMLAAAFFLFSAIINDTLDQTPMVVWKVLSGYIAGFSLFTYFHFHIKPSKAKPFIAVLVGLAPLTLAFAVPTSNTFAMNSALGLGLLAFLWNHAPVHPILEDENNSVASKPDVDGILNGPKVFRRWFNSHLWATGGIILILLLAASPIIRGHSWNYSGVSVQVSMEAMFVVFAAMGSSLACLKVMHLPVPKSRVYPVIALPVLIAMLIGGFVKEGMNYAQKEIFFTQRLEVPIQFTAGKSVEGEGTKFQITVPPQMLAMTGPSVEPTHNGYRVGLFSGKRLFNPYFAGEYDLEERRDLMLISEQLHRALEDYYGTAPSLEWLREEFCQFQSDRQYFHITDFNKWQEGFAAKQAGTYQTQPDYWREQTLYLMPAKMLNWVLWWGIALAFAFTMRFEHWSRGKQILQRTVWGLSALGIFFWQLLGSYILHGSTQEDAYAKRLTMIPFQQLRGLLPENMALAWISVTLVGVAVYFLGLKMFRPNQWAGFEEKYSKGGEAFHKWKRV